MRGTAAFFVLCIVGLIILAWILLTMGGATIHG